MINNSMFCSKHGLTSTDVGKSTLSKCTCIIENYEDSETVVKIPSKKIMKLKAKITKVSKWIPKIKL